MSFISTVGEYKEQEGEFLAASLSLSLRQFHHDDRDDDDVEIENGVVTGLAETLTYCLFPSSSSEEESIETKQPEKEEKVATTEQSSTRGVSNVHGFHVAVLVSSLSTVLECSGGVLANHVHIFEEDIIVSSEKIVELFSFPSWEGDIAIQQVVLSSTIKIIRYISPYVKNNEEHQRLLDAVLTVMNTHENPPDIRADATTVVCQLARQRNNQYMPILEEHASSLISTITTASLPFDEEQNNTMIEYLYELAATSKVFQHKMIKRRCTVLAIANNLKPTSDNRMKIRAIEFCRGIFSDPESIEWHDNVNILTKQVIEFTRKERSDELQVAGLALLQNMLSLEIASNQALMDTLRCLAYSGVCDGVIRGAASTYCQGFREEVDPGRDELWTLVDFTTFPYANVRAEALAAIEWSTSKSDLVKILLNETDMVDNFTLIVRHGSKADCTTALDIMRKLARSSLYHNELCCHVGFLREVIEFVTREDITNQSAHFYAVEMVLALLSNGDNIEAFLPFRSLLPWLVSFVNTTTADDDIKKPIVSVIVRLSQGYLKDI